MGEQIVLAHLCGVSAAQMKLRLGLSPLPSLWWGLPAPKSGQLGATWAGAAGQFGEASPMELECKSEEGASLIAGGKEGEPGPSAMKVKARRE